MLNKIGYCLLMVLILLGLNTSTIVWLVYNFLPHAKYPEFSMWDVGLINGIKLVNGEVIKLEASEFLSVSEKGAIYLFMIIGGICSAMFIKWLFLDTVNKIREKKKSDLKKHLKDYES